MLAAVREGKRGASGTHLDGIDGIHNRVFLRLSVSPQSVQILAASGVDKQLCPQMRRLPCSAAARSSVVGIHSCRFHRVSFTLRRPAWKVAILCPRNVLIVLHGLACGLGHLGHSFRRAAVGFRLEIQGDDVANSGLEGGLQGGKYQARDSGRDTPGQESVTQWMSSPETTCRQQLSEPGPSNELQKTGEMCPHTGLVCEETWWWTDECKGRLHL
jgi:hypothetical protein